MSLTSDFLVCVFLFVCFGVYARERQWEPILWVEENPPIFSCFVFASGSCLKALGAQAFCLVSAGSQREERTEWTVSGLPDLAVKGRAGFGMVFQSHSYLELCQDGNCGLVEDSYAVHEAWRWASVCSPHAVLNLFSWLQCTNSTETKQSPGLFSHSHTGFWIPVSCSQVGLSFSLQRHMSCLSFSSEISSSCWRSLALDKPLHCTERAGWTTGPSDCTCGVASLVHRSPSSFLGYYQGLPTVLLASDSASTTRLKFPSEIPICWCHFHLKPFSGATLSIKSKVVCMAYRVQ